MSQKLLYFLPIALLGIMVATALIVKSRFPQDTKAPLPQTVDSTPSPEVSPTLKPRNPHFTLVPTLVTMDNQTFIKVSVTPDTNDLTLRAFALKLNLNHPSGTLTPRSAEIEMAESLQNTDWTFPFAQLETSPDGSLNANLSAAFISTKAYQLDASPFDIALIPVDITGNPLDVTITADPYVTELLDVQAQAMHLTNEASAINVQGDYEQ